jgi:hypothetical protein
VDTTAPAAEEPLAVAVEGELEGELEAPSTPSSTPATRLSVGIASLAPLRPSSAPPERSHAPLASPTQAPATNPHPSGVPKPRPQSAAVARWSSRDSPELNVHASHDTYRTPMPSQPVRRPHPPCPRSSNPTAQGTMRATTTHTVAAGTARS